MLSFANVFITPRVRASLHKVVQAQQHEKFWKLVAKLKEGKFEIPGLNVEKLYSKSGKLFSARMTKEMRLIFSMRRDQNGISLIIHELNHHDEAYDRIERRYLSTSNLQDAGSILRELEEEQAQAISKLPEQLPESTDKAEPSCPGPLFKVPYYVLSDPERYIQFEKNLDRYLVLNEEQEEILATRERAWLVQGPAGTGKTTLALFSALNIYEENTEDAVYLFTYHEELACVCRAYKVNLVGEDDEENESGSGIRVFSYIDFCRHHLRESLKKKDREKNWIDKQQSIEILQSILLSKSRWSRTFSASDFYGLIYSTLKGRFMPGTEELPASKEDYERIFKDYGRMPQDFEELLEIFAIYQSRLERGNHLDEADIIRLSYQSLKRNALLAGAERRLWIVIDEVQDFTELEWKSILLFWENHGKQLPALPSYPFLCGDINQNISRSGFRWQELETYLQSILRKLHRPNALKKVTLHQNYRNTRQIHQLATFIRRFGSDTSDLGLAPDTEGDRPRLVVASDQEFLLFLREQCKDRTITNPLVVLVEDEESLSFLRRELANSQSVFLLSLHNSKGMEFEDVIIHRAFSSCIRSSVTSSAEISRFFDLWYMGISRARKNLLLVQSPEDDSALKELLQDRVEEFFQLTERLSPARGFSEFWAKREAQMPNYNVIFLERKIAQDLFQEFLNEERRSESDNQLSEYAVQCKERALNLWRRCLDYSALGKALMHLQCFDEAAQFLKRSGHFKESAQCLEAVAQYHDAAIQYERIGLIEEAARCFEYDEDYSSAARLHEQTGNWMLAAENNYNAGDLGKAAHCCERAGMSRSAAEIYRLRGKYQKAAQLFAQVEDFSNAADMYLRIKDKLAAAHCFERAGQYEKAVELYETLNRFAEAGQAARQACLHSKAGNLFLKAGRLLESARSFEEAGLPENAANLYMRTKDFARAADCYLQAGKLEKAVLMLEQSGQWQKALQFADEKRDKLLVARCSEKLGEFKRAAELYLEQELITEAAVCYEKDSDFLRAADLYLKAGNLQQAAQCLAKVNKSLEAAKLFVLSGQTAIAFDLVVSITQPKTKTDDEFKQLLAWCIESKRTSAAAQLLELKQDYLAAAEKYKECLMLVKGAECLEKFGRHKEAGHLYQESGVWEKAANCFKQAKLFQEAGRCLERLQNWSEAKKMYERCLDADGIARCDSAMNWL